MGKIPKGVAMRLITIQDKPAYDNLCSTGTLRCNPELAEWLQVAEFRISYDWLVKQMERRIGTPPQGVIYPLWAWHTIDGKPAKTDLRRTVLNNYHGEQYALTIEIPDEQVLLSDEGNWHHVLNNCFLNGADNKADYEKTETWFDALQPNEKQKVKTMSWERIFDVEPFENDWHIRGHFVQATFWELRMDQIINAR